MAKIVVLVVFAAAVALSPSAHAKEAAHRRFIPDRPDRPVSIVASGVIPFPPALHRIPPPNLTSIVPLVFIPIFSWHAFLLFRVLKNGYIYQ